MVFWTSKEPGVLPKWIFWFYLLLVPFFLYLATLEGRAPIAAGGVVGLAYSARRNEIGFLWWTHILAIIVGIYLLWASTKLWPNWLANKGWSTDGILITMAYASVWIWYLNRYRLKGGIASLPPSTLELNNPVEGVAATADRQVASVETDNAPNDDYANELKLYEEGDLDESLWAKHLVEAEGDADKAKWNYIKERVATAPARRLDEHRAIHNAAIDAYLEKEQAGRSQHPSGRGWQLAGLAFLLFLVFVIGFG